MSVEEGQRKRFGCRVGEGGRSRAVEWRRSGEGWRVGSTSWTVGGCELGSCGSSRSGTWVLFLALTRLISLGMAGFKLPLIWLFFPSILLNTLSPQLVNREINPKYPPSSFFSSALFSSCFFSAAAVAVFFSPATFLLSAETLFSKASTTATLAGPSTVP